jgi:8-oxo-dGTP pyrophosphatase MutT (NUDIX family)
MRPWQVLRSQVVYDRSPWLRVIEQDVCLPNGQGISSYILAHPREYAMVFALTQGGLAPLVRQYKHGIGQLSYELPAGYLNEGETPRQCAERELLEETGYQADAWQLLSSLVLDANRSSARAHLFLARHARQVAAPHLDSTEDLVMSLHPPSTLRAMVMSGRIDGIASVAGILLALDTLGM